MLRLWQLEHQYGCELHLVWGCEFKEQLRRDAQLRELWRQVFVPRPLDPREDALRGGRTEPFQLQYECTPEEEIVAIDIVCVMKHTMIIVVVPFSGQPIPVCDEGEWISGGPPAGAHT